MHIGRCKNCKYMDLVENVASKCPRCGARMISLGVDSVRWNSMSSETKNAIISEVFPEEFEEQPESAQTEALETTNPEQTWSAQEQEGTEALENAGGPETEGTDNAEAVVETSQEPAGEEPGEAEETEEPPQAEDEQESAADKEDADQSVEERVYVCYSCNTIAAHDGANGRYFCHECGSEMVDVGFTKERWADLSKEEKRKVSEDAKIRHMVTAIKSATLEGGSESTPNIINVV